MKKVNTIALVTIALSLLLGVGLLFTPELDFIAALNVAETVALTILHAGICVLFFMGGRAFKREFKKAFAYVSAGIVLLALAVLQYTILGSANALDSFWVTSGAIELAFIASIVSLLIGQAGFAQVMGVAHLRRYIVITVLVAIAAGGLAALLPSPRTDIDPHTLAVTAALYTVQAVMLIAFLPLAYRIRAKAGALYVPMFAWLLTSWAVYALQMVVTVYGLFFFEHDHWYVVYGATMVFFFTAGLALLKAGVELNRIRFREPLPPFTQLSFYGTPKKHPKDQAASAVEAIAYAAGLSSNRDAIAPILDGLRVITSTVAPNQPLTPDQQTKLAGIYLQVEDALVNKERIAQFTQTSLRQRLLQKFQDPQDSVFWNSLRPKV